MTVLIINDQRDEGDGVTAENTELPNVIGWGETPSEAVSDLTEQTYAVLLEIAHCQNILDHM